MEFMIGADGTHFDLKKGTLADPEFRAWYKRVNGAERERKGMRVLAERDRQLGKVTPWVPPNKDFGKSWK